MTESSPVTRLREALAPFDDPDFSESDAIEHGRDLEAAAREALVWMRGERERQAQTWAIASQAGYNLSAAKDRGFAAARIYVLLDSGEDEK